MAPILMRPGLRRLERVAQPKRSVHIQPAATWRAPQLRRSDPLRRVSLPLTFRSSPPSLPVAMPGSSGFIAASDPGPNPYAGFSRSFTDVGGIRLGFFVKDERAWRWWLHAALWLMAMAATLWFLAYLSPYPLVPRGCQLFAVCPVSLPERQVLINFLLLAGAGMLYASFLFGEKWRPASVEIRPDCMIVDDADVFWQRHMELGWPELGYDCEREATVLRGVYGTRVVVYLVLHASDEQDRTIQLIGAHLQFAMQQLWDQPVEDK